MIFNSFDFLFFLPVVFCLYWFVFNRSLAWQNVLVMLASYVFYSWWDARFLLLLFYSTVLDFVFGALIAKSEGRRRKYVLWIGVFNNLAVLGFFKYYNFFAGSFAVVFQKMGFRIDPYLVNIILPVGISFYTFHGMSYLFDIYRNKFRPVKRFIDYAVFVSFFPLLVAGPIERAAHLLPQVVQERVFNYRQAMGGVKLILWGMFKKIVVADYLAGNVNYVFSEYNDHSAGTLIWTAISFSFQIYGDFSGYSDIAIGTAKLFGFELLSNFKFPYFSRNIAEFWRRWHISLSSWFRDYLYIPLGGSKVGKWKAVRNVFIIFIISGFWHGANWTFIAWGAVHAIGFLPLLLLKKNRVYTEEIVAANRSVPNLSELRKMIFTFAFVSFAWIFFRSPSLAVAIDYMAHIGADLVNHPEKIFAVPRGISGIFLIILMLLIDWKIRRNEREFNLRVPLIFRYIIYAGLAIATVVFFLNSVGSSFIYFQF